VAGAAAHHVDNARAAFWQRQAVRAEARPDVGAGRRAEGCRVSGEPDDEGDVAGGAGAHGGAGAPPTLLTLSPAGAAPPAAITGVAGAAAEWPAGLAPAARTESVTGLALSPDGHTLLASTHDGGARAWDVRPFCAAPSRWRALFLGGAAGRSAVQDLALVRAAWSGDGERVACGGVDRLVRVWDAATARVAFALPGHAGVAQAIAFHPSEPVLASGGADRKVLLGELGTAAEA
jgi:hypothetical protein